MNSLSRSYAALWAAFLVVGIVGCARFAGKSGDEEAAVSTSDTADAAAAAVLEPKEEDHKIQPFESIRIITVGETNLSGDFKVQASGKISFPYLEDLNVTNKTCADLEKELKTSFKEKQYLVDPQVIVSVMEYRRRFVSVTGEVNKPGEVILPGEQEITILDAIGAAGGPTRQAKNQVLLIRQGRVKKFKYDQLKRTDVAQLEKCRPGDTIEVPTSVW